VATSPTRLPTSPRPIASGRDQPLRHIGLLCGDQTVDDLLVLGGVVRPPTSSQSGLSLGNCSSDSPATARPLRGSVAKARIHKRLALLGHLWYSAFFRQISHGHGFLISREVRAGVVLEEFDLGEKLLFDVFGASVVRGGEQDWLRPQEMKNLTSHYTRGKGRE